MPINPNQPANKNAAGMCSLFCHVSHFRTWWTRSRNMEICYEINLSIKCKMLQFLRDRVPHILYQCCMVDPTGLLCSSTPSYQWLYHLTNCRCQWCAVISNTRLIWATYYLWSEFSPSDGVFAYVTACIECWCSALLCAHCVEFAELQSDDHLSCYDCVSDQLCDPGFLMCSFCAAVSFPLLVFDHCSRFM